MSRCTIHPLCDTKENSYSMKLLNKCCASSWVALAECQLTNRQLTLKSIWMDKYHYRWEEKICNLVLWGDCPLSTTWGDITMKISWRQTNLMHLLYRVFLEGSCIFDKLFCNVSIKNWWWEFSWTIILILPLLLTVNNVTGSLEISFRHF